MIKTDALIIGAGPTGLFTAHQLNLIGLNCEVVDNLVYYFFWVHKPYQSYPLPHPLFLEAY